MYTCLREGFEGCQIWLFMLVNKHDEDYEHDDDEEEDDDIDN